MFRLDPLLLERHPNKYVTLLRSEAHYRQTPGFWHHFLRGITESGARPPVGKLLLQLRVHDAEWWKKVTTSEGRSTMTAEDWAALQSVLAEHAGLGSEARELAAENRR